MTTIGKQTIGDVQRCRSPPAQAPAQAELRQWRPVVGQQGLGLLGRRFPLAQHQR
ncbi:hypothetical protein D3C81_1947540 [compost metagenome]